MKPIADIIRHKKVDVAEKTLSVMPRSTSRIMLKLLRSAMANAENNAEIGDVEALWVSRVDVGPGPTMKRMRFKARGRVALMRRRTSQVRIVLEEMPETAPSRGSRAGSKGRSKLPGIEVKGG